MPFKKGQSGNPRGRATEKPFRDALRLELAEASGNQKRLREIAKALMDKAATGDTQAIREFADRLDGKVPQALTNDVESGPLRMMVSWKKSK